MLIYFGVIQTLVMYSILNKDGIFLPKIETGYAKKIFQSGLCD